MSLSELKKYTFKSRYASYNLEEKRRETWNECVTRSEMMMLEKYSGYNINEIIKEAYSAVKRKEVLGSQRVLQFAGKAIVKHNARLYNCLEKNTQFITNRGVKSFIDFKDGDKITVLTHTGEWKTATVHNYGKQWLSKITFVRGLNESVIYATNNHRWLLKEGIFTESLKIGDSLYKAPDVFSEFDYDKTTNPLEKLYWCYGYILGDGTLIKYNNEYKYSSVRLCDEDRKYKYRFEENGFTTSSSVSIKGDFIAYTGSYLKTLPNPEIDSPELIRSFIRGYLDADGTKNNNPTGNLFSSIQSSDTQNIDFIKNIFPIAGQYIVSEEDLTGQQTNFGIRPITSKFRIIHTFGDKYTTSFKVKSIENNAIYDDVWCLEVEDNHTFILDNGIVTGNCVMSYLDRPRFFQEATYLLLCGCGAGFSVQKHHVAKLPKLVPSLDGTITYKIPDTIEGWANAIGILVNSYFQNGIYPEYEGKRVYFDYTQIRPAGSKLSYTTGKAPGPEPLKNTIEKIRKLLDDAIGQDKLRPIQAYDIVMHSSDCVLAGGIRRSATIALFSPDDEEMMKAKTGNWFAKNPQRGRSNNSTVLIKKNLERNQFNSIFTSTKEFGEPGFWLAESTEHLGNPCGEVSTCPYWVFDEKLYTQFIAKHGENATIYCQPEEIGLKSGWQFCNLSSINGKKCDTPEKFYAACKNAAIIGTLQAGYTSFPYLGEISELITKKEALLGVSITGMMDNPNILLDEQIQRKGADIVRKINIEIAELLKINQAARLTVVKPEGTSSCLLGTSSGVHPHHAKRYFRRIQSNKLEPIYQYFNKINPKACEHSVWSSNDTDDIITFCIEVEDGAKLKNQLSAIDLLKIVQTTKQNWIKYGATSNSIRSWLSHNVSNTIHVKTEEWNDVADFIFNNKEDFCGISLLPASGDKDYTQAPFCTVYTMKEIVNIYGDCAGFVSGLIERGLDLYEDNLWRACDVLLGLGIQPKGNSKLEWVTRCKSFADKYLDSDIKKLTYLMKDIHNWKLWLDLKREYKDVDYELFIENEEEVDINHHENMACMGGSCSII